MSTVLYYLRAFVEVLMVSWFLYRFYKAISQTVAQSIIRLGLALIVIYTISYLLGFRMIISLFGYLTIPFICLIGILFQPELRRAFTSITASRGKFFGLGNQSSGEQIDTILNACEVLREKRRGALIVFPRKLGLKNIIDSGTKLNADLSTALILTVFDHDTPLHDGALIVEGNKIIAAGCYLPLSDQNDIKKTFGTRHRAALGMTEESDAVVVIVSEETGAISISCNANLYYDLDRDVLKKMLLALFSYDDITPEEIEDNTADEVE